MTDRNGAGQLRRLFDELVELGPVQRASRLVAIGESDPGLREEVEALLQAHDESDAFGRDIRHLMHSARKAAAGADENPGSLVGQTVAQYIVLEWLGGGGMGDVYKAWDTRLERTVALKFLPARLSTHEEAKQRFIQEAKSASVLEHANICTIYEIGESETGQLFIAMPCYGGENLRAKIGRGPLPVRDAVQYAIQMAEGLRQAHQAGIIHRDVKPANVMVTEHEHVKLLDFGIAKFGETDLTRTGTQPGTVAYMSPEHARGDQVDQRTDLWSLGVVLYEMLAGQRPFGGAHEASILLSIQSEDPAPVDKYRHDVSEGLVAVVEKLLRKNPTERYQSAEDLLAVLRMIADHPDAVHLPPSLWDRLHLPVKPTWYFAVPTLVLAGVLWVAQRDDAAPARSINSLAVLPLANFSGDPEQAYFADGMTEELIAVLGQIESLRVISRTSAMRYKGKPKSLPEIARELDVAAVVEGSVAQTGDHLQISVRLIDGPTEERLWEQRFEREVRDVVTLQREVALSVAREIQLELAARDRDRMSSARAVDPEAFRLYLRGLQQRNINNIEALKGAATYFEMATRRDSSFAPAFAGLATVYSILGGFTALYPREEAETLARAAAERALSLDPGLSDAHLSLGLVLEILDWDFDGADRLLRQALALNPGNSVARYELGLLLARRGQLRQALFELKHAMEQDPLSPLIHFGIGWVHVNSGRFDEAIASGQEVLRLQPDFSHAHIVIGNALLAKGLHDGAIAELKELVAANPENAHSLGYLGHAYAAAGRREAALSIVSQLESRWRGGDYAAFDIAMVFAGLGEKGLALDWLDEAYSMRDASLLYLKLDPLYAPLRNEQRFQDLLKKVGLGS